jgi:opacity protein-like surface antigen
MKKGLVALVALASILAFPVMAAEEINSGVIHNYKFVGVGYGYLHDFANADVEGHGIVGTVSIEDQGFVLDVGSGLLPSGYFWMDEEAADINVWNVTARFGYVLRLLDNHLNIIPRVGGSLTGIEIDDPVFGDISDENWSIIPGVGASFAITDRFAINGGYGWNYNFDSEESDHVFNGGAKFALFEHLGLSVNAFFIEDFGFSGATATVDFHF